MSAAHEPSIASEVLRLCNRDTLPAPPPEDEDAPLSNVKEHLRTSEPGLDTIPAPPPSAANVEEDGEHAPPTIPGPPKLPTALRA